MSNQFRLIGIRLLDGCAPYIQKNLKINQWYLFDSAYEVVDETPVKKGETFDDFYTNLTDTQGNTSQPSNDLAINIHALVGENGSGKSALLDIFLRLVNNLACRELGHLCEIPIDTDNKYLIYIFRVYGEIAFAQGENVYILRQKREHNEEDHNTPITIEAGKGIPEDKFASITLLQISKDGQEQPLEQDSKPILQNFAYTILVNYSIYAFNIWDYEKEKIVYIPNGDEGPKYWYWLNGLFHKNDGYQTPIVLNPKRDEGNIEINTENDLSRDRMMALSLLSDEHSLYEYGIATLTVTHTPRAYETKEKNLKERILSTSQHSETKDKIQSRLEDLFSTCRKVWETLLGPNNTSNNPWLEDSIGYLAYKTISIAFKYPQCSKEIDSVNIKIRKFIDEPKVRASTDLKKGLKILIEYLLTDTSHITNKLHQARYLLKPEVCSFYADLLEQIQPQEENTQDKTEDKNKISLKDLKSLYQTLDNVEKVKEEAPKEALLNPLYLVPSPIFDISFTVTKERKGVPFQSLSSGEKQLIYSISTIMYHIKNVDSVNDSSKYKYEHINLVLDEIELYYHPEYQRQFISRLIKGLRSLQLKRIKSVNVLLATHSPFILSDIPHSKVLYLKEGEPCNAGIEQTFGANIHTLFRNSFFIEGMPIGEFAKEKIKGLSDRLKKGKDLDNLEREIKLIGEPLIRRQLMEQLYQKPDIYEEIERLKDLVKCLEEKTMKQSPKQDEL